MITTIKKGISKEKIKILFEKLATNSNSCRGFDAYNFRDAVKYNEEAMEIQKQLKDEWR